ncbi:MAG TPA: hypothetical protein VK658_22960 [Chryseolinea sp.]|nr:hypothetical protein [Chryseolinea sp.]
MMKANPMRSTFLRKVIPIVLIIFSRAGYAQENNAEDSMKIRFQQNTHAVVLDAESGIIPWTVPASNAYDYFLRQRWNFIKTKVPNSPGPEPRSGYPMYYFYCAYRASEGQLIPDQWMNDIGEKIPNWFESARLYCAYSGDSSVMNIVEALADYALGHGMSPASFAWPDFPYTAANAGDLEFRGFTSAERFVLHEIQVDHAAEMGLTFYRLYQYNGKTKYREAAIKIANTLMAKIRKGSATQSPWPYRVVMDSGKITAGYGANWTGAYLLFDELIRAEEGKTKAYDKGRTVIRQFLLNYPLKTGYWTDGHSDTPVNSNTYKSNLSASNFKLFLFDFPDFAPQWKSNMPALIAWTEKYFVTRGSGGEPGNMWGANVVGEQDDFLVKMDYQTARYAAECARWYAVSKDDAFKEKAYRSLNWVTYCSDAQGMAFESPLSKDVSNWWSDCYGEGPRMFYHVFAAIPEWAPPAEDHILYSTGVLKEVVYEKGKATYFPAVAKGIEYLKLSYLPGKISVGDKVLKPLMGQDDTGYTVRELAQGDYAITIYRSAKGKVIVSEQ